jgi:hypothetical protein
MIHLLADTTASDGFREWTVTEWVAFFAALLTFLTSLAALIKGIIADARSKEAKKESSDAKADSSAARAVGEVNSQRIGNVSNRVDLNNVATTTQLNALSLAVPPPLSPPAPTPESIARAMDTVQPSTPEQP